MYLHLGCQRVVITVEAPIGARSQCSQRRSRVTSGTDARARAVLAGARGTPVPRCQIGSRALNIECCEIRT